MKNHTLTQFNIEPTYPYGSRLLLRTFSSLGKASELALLSLNEKLPLLAAKDGAKGGNDYSHDEVEDQDAKNIFHNDVGLGVVM